MEAAHLGIAATTGPTVQHDHGLAIGIPALLVIQGMAVVDLERADVEGFYFGVERAHG